MSTPTTAPAACPLAVLLTKLVGLPQPFPHSTGTTRGVGAIGKTGIGYSQFNEVLLSVGYPRISDSFFQFLVNGSADYERHSAFKSLDAIKEGVDRFRRAAMLRMGNIRYAFEYLRSLSRDDLAGFISILEPLPEDHFTERHEAMHPIEPIRGEDTYYLGYIVHGELKERLKKNPDDREASEELTKREGFVRQGVRNHLAYLASDHMDVYVATSMRRRHEYFFVNEIAGKIFADVALKKLKLRWFDPTQAYCGDRIDKGLSEGLMLKRAKCTVYFAQESDTLGKDSELASTLAQGKPVIAFVPDSSPAGADKQVKWLLDVAKRLYPKTSRSDLIREQLQVFAPDLAWKDKAIQKWIGDPNSLSEAEMIQRLAAAVRGNCEKRSKLLGHEHPLGIQVSLETGVANGVLVARSTRDVAELIRRIVTNTLEFIIEEVDIGGRSYLFLKEKITSSVFRVVSGDAELTNSFWNFYLRPAV